MLTLLIRTVLTYIFLIFIMRLMGKRQLGELEITDLVITLLLSEIATVALTDTSKSLLHTIIPVFTLALLEMATSWLALKVPKFQKLLSPKPTILIHNGKIDRKQMQKARVSLDELMCELRQKEISDIEQVQYAIMESSGKISVIKKAAESPPTSAQLGLHLPECGIMRTVYCDGTYDDNTLLALGLDRHWVDKQLKAHNCSHASVFFLMTDDAGNVRMQQK